jgi:hypothetical protein
MTTGTFTSDLTAALTVQARQLARVRRIGIAESWSWVAQSCRENIALSQGDQDALGYWRAALAIAQRAATEAKADPMWEPAS